MRAPATPAAALRPADRARRAQPAVLATLGTAVLAAAAGLAGGLLRSGALDAGRMQAAGAWLPQAAAHHAALMLAVGLGSLIALERAVALKQRWALAAPLASALAGPALLAGQPGAAALLLVLAGLLLVAVHAAVWRLQPAAHTRLLVVAALAGLTGNTLFAVGAAAQALLPWWFLLPVLTIAAERLEMTRLTRQHALAAPLLAAVVALLLSAALLSSMAAGLAAAGGVLFGGGLVLLALWCAVFDIARRTVRAQGLPRYMALSLLCGYAWLALAGWAWAGTALGCPGRELALHALGLGFIGSMVLAHAPVVAPVLARVKLQFGAWFYAPLLALQGTLLLRLVAGIGHPALRQAGAVGNVLALLLFVATLAASAWLWQRRRAAGRHAAGLAAWPLDGEGPHAVPPHGSTAPHPQRGA